MLRSLFLSLLLAAAATAQTRPDVNGTWKQDNTRSSARPGTKYTYWNKIEYKDPNLTLTTMFTGGDRPDSSSSRTYTTDGKPTVSSDREGDQFTTTVKWEANALIFETVEKERANTLTTRETWTFSADGKTLTKKIQRTGSRGDSDQTYVLDKQ